MYLFKKYDRPAIFAFPGLVLFEEEAFEEAYVTPIQWEVFHIIEWLEYHTVFQAS